MNGKASLVVKTTWAAFTPIGREGDPADQVDVSVKRCGYCFTVSVL
jgi:hypothetical protein